MDNYNFGPEKNTNTEYPKVKTVNSFSVIAMILGFISLFTCSTVLIPLGLGSFGIILAVLSKEKDLKMSGPAAIGFATSILSIVLAIALTCSTVYMLKHNSAYRQQVSQTFEKVYGMTLDEYLDTYGGEYNFLKQVEGTDL